MISAGGMDGEIKAPGQTWQRVSCDHAPNHAQKGEDDREGSEPARHKKTPKRWRGKRDPGLSF
jgi:hypothetical protein